ncbi:hypothetical protein MHYP_G00211410 [Metynnis hypsauchen]
MLFLALAGAILWVVWFLSMAAPSITRVRLIPQQQRAQRSSLAPASQMRAIFQLFPQPLASRTKAASEWRHVAGHLVKWLAPR